VGPVGPEAPVFAACPGDPVGPVLPAGPVAPVLLAEPGRPVGPVWPVAPVAPVEPLMPLNAAVL